MKRQTVATLPLLVIVLLGLAGGLSAPSVSASSLVSGQEPRHQHQQSVDDRVALMALYDSAGGVAWTTKTNWGTTEPIGMWSGVTTVSGRVTGLDLRTTIWSAPCRTSWAT